MNGRRLRIDAGFTLVELLVASLIALLLAGAVLGFARQAQHIFRLEPELSDQQQRLRISVETLRRDLLMAGAGFYAGPATGPLNIYMAPVMPYRAFGSSADPNAGTFFRRDTISVVYIDSTPAQTTLAAALPAGSLDARVEAAPNCPPDTATQTCGFESGARVVVLGDDGRWDTFNVGSSGAGLLVLEHRGAPSSSHMIADPIATVKLATYYLKTDGTGASQLFRYDGWASESPVVDDILSLTFDYFGDVDPPRRTPMSLDDLVGPWTTYGPKPPPIGTTRGSWPSGENCVFMVVDDAHAPRLADLTGTGSNVAALTPAELTDGPWCPDDVAPNRFDADLLRVRNVRVTLRIRSTLASLRGPSGTLLARRGALSMPGDVQVQFDVAPRNLQR